MGLFDFFRKRVALEGDGDEAAGAARSAAAGFPPPGPPLPPEPDAPDARYAEALDVDPAQLGAAAPALDVQEREVAGALLEHFEANRPGPASFPGLALRVLEVMRDPDVQIADLARLVEDDPALSAGLLVLANSVLFRGVNEIRTVREAIARLGLAEVARISSALATRSLYQAGVRAEFAAFSAAWDELFYHAATVARAAADLARLRRVGSAEVVYLGGMLHDVGKSLALRSLAALTLEGKVTTPDPDALERILHRVHVEVGGEAHREWGLPRHLAELAVLHHDAAIPAGPEHAELHLVRLVSALHLLGGERKLHPDAAGEALQSARALGLGPERVAALRGAIGETGQWVRMMFGDGKGGPSTAPAPTVPPPRR